ncbi:Periplasmic serine endoprotease DegP precursor [Blastopirellula retiformator]|uniref:Periplasmic serine endoprotease DegP n=2 Tax=Blastopirellula retiformator TaxID=2527970 RepID=A0A5C5V8X6_9BACT|nr:Periplasmic serine endoprotease DegP precursor [Blastopirellula retiformator]
MVKTMQTMTKTWFTAAVALTCLANVAAVSRADSSIYEKTLKSTAWVLAKTGGETSSGTGVLVDAEKKLLVTNFHVVGDARAAVVFFADLTDGKPKVERSHYLTNVKKLGIRGRVIAVDRKRDLALIELDKIPTGATAIGLSADGIGPGEDVQSIGNPGSTDALWVYTSGTVRSVYQKQFRTGAGEHDFKVVETQSPINSGDSGGPVVNNEGELVAISQAIAPKARLVSYSVDVSEVKDFLGGSWKLAPIPAEKLLEEAELTFTTHESGHYEVKFDEKGYGDTSVFLTKETEYYERADIRKVWSLAAKLDKAPSVETTMKLLAQNGQTKIGAWSIERTPNGEYLVIYTVKIDATAAPDAVKSTMQYVAKLTNVSKKELQPQESVQNASQTLDSWLN